MKENTPVTLMRSLFLAIVALAVTACGGGSGSAKQAEQDDMQAGQVSITADNAVEVVDTVISPDPLESTDIATQRGLTALGGSGSGAGVQQGVQQLVSAALAPSLNKLQSVLANSQQRDIDIQESCLQSGSVRVSGIVSDTGLSVGDQLSVDFDNCMDGGAQIDGSITLTFTQVSDNFATADEFSFSISIAFVELSVATEEEFASIDGDAGLSQTVSEGSTLLSISGTSLAVMSGAGSVTLSNFEIGEYIDITEQTTSLVISGSVASEELAGSVTVDTRAPFVRNAGDFYPSEGMLLVEGAGGSSVLFTALDNTNVQFEVDVNGDGMVDETITTTWADALPDFF